MSFRKGEAVQAGVQKPGLILPLGVARTWGKSWIHSLNLGQAFNPTLLYESL